jgi:putative methyltransferase (TIGR04325 family)
VSTLRARRDMNSLNSTLKPFVPPILVNLLRRWKVPVVRFTGDYGSWEEAATEASGYDEAGILNRVTASTRKVVAGEATYERDSVVFDHIEYSWPLLASLLQVALECGSLRVVDFGGSLGSTWAQNRKYLSRVSSIPVAWRVVEQESFVSVGRAEFETDRLSFHHSIKEASASGVDAVLFSSSLCYVSKPEYFLRETALADARYLIVDRLPVIPGDRDRIAMQKVTEPIYSASYPIRFFAEQRLMDGWLAGWRLIERWDCELQPDPKSRCCGFFMEKR